MGDQGKLGYPPSALTLVNTCQSEAICMTSSWRMPDIDFLCFLAPGHLPVAAAALGAGRPAPQEEAYAAVGVPEHPPPPPAVAATATTTAAALPPQGIVDQDMMGTWKCMVILMEVTWRRRRRRRRRRRSCWDCRAPPLNADGKAKVRARMEGSFSAATAAITHCLILLSPLLVRCRLYHRTKRGGAIIPQTSPTGA